MAEKGLSASLSASLNGLYFSLNGLSASLNGLSSRDLLADK